MAAVAVNGIGRRQEMWGFGFGCVRRNCVACGMAVAMDGIGTSGREWRRCTYCTCSIARRSTPGPIQACNRRPWGTSISPKLGPRARNLVWLCTKVTKWFYPRIRSYLGRIRWHQPAQNLKNLPRSTPGRPIIDDLERYIGTNPSERSFGKSIMVHDKATEDWCDVSWAYLSSYIYHQSVQSLKNLPRPTPGPIINDLERRIGTNPSERSFGKSIMVHDKATEDWCDVSWAYLSSYIYITSPPRISKICPDRPREP